MRRLIVSICTLLAATAGFARGPGTVIPVGLSPLDQTFYNANGTYLAAALPKFCINAHTLTASTAQNLSLIQQIGATCARVDVNNWNAIEQSLGVYTWTTADAFWNTVCAAGIKPIFTATYNNALYASGIFEGIIGSTNVTGYQNFAVALANHYATACPGAYVELFNEPNLVEWTTSPWVGSSYAAMLAPVSAAVKAAQAGYTVWSGGVSPGGVGTQLVIPWIISAVSAGSTFSWDPLGGFLVFPKAPEPTAAAGMASSSLEAAPPCPSRRRGCWASARWACSSR